MKIYELMNIFKDIFWKEMWGIYKGKKKLNENLFSKVSKGEIVQSIN